MANKPKTWNMIDPNGNEITVTNLAQFCQDKNLNYHKVWNMLNGESVYGSVTCAGYKKSGKSPSAHIALDDIQLIHDDGRMTQISRYRNRVAKEAGISTSSLHRLLTDVVATVAGWRLKYHSAGMHPESIDVMIDSTNYTGELTDDTIADAILSIAKIITDNEGNQLEIDHEGEADL